MIAYFDASAAVKLLLDEDGSEEARALWASADLASCARLGTVEVHAALAAASRTGRLDAREHAEAAKSWEELWSETDAIDLSDRIADAAGELAQRHALTGADAVHLASALEVADGETAMAVWDRRLHAAALAEGLAVLPASLD